MYLGGFEAGGRRDDFSENAGGGGDGGGVGIVERAVGGVGEAGLGVG